MFLARVAEAFFGRWQPRAPPIVGLWKNLMQSADSFNGLLGVMLHFNATGAVVLGKLLLRTICCDCVKLDSFRTHHAILKGYGLV